jgi:ADP-heptose:LPS heptosyltransferase
LQRTYDNPRANGLRDRGAHRHSISLVVFTRTPRTLDTMSPAAPFVTRRNEMLARASEVIAPILRVATRLRAGRGPLPPADWRRGLIVGHTHIGDVLYRTSSLPHLRRLLPNCAWDYLAAPVSAPLLRNNPFVDRVLAINVGDTSWELADGGLNMLRARDYDVVLCTNSNGHAPDFLLAAVLGAPTRVGFTYKGLSGLINYPIAIPFPSAFPAYFRAIVGQVGGEANASWSLRPEIYLSDEDEAEADRLLVEHGLRDVGMLIGCAPATRQPGGWPHAFFLEVAARVRAATNAHVVVFGSESERPALDAAMQTRKMQGVLLAGRSSLRGFAALLRRCQLLISNDSGPRHLANAVRTPVAFARNLTFLKAEAGIYCDSELDLAPDDERLSPERATERSNEASPIQAADRVLSFLSSHSRQ